MQEKTTLTADEKGILIQSLEKFEKSARRWKYGRYYLLGMVCFLYVSGIYGIWPSVKDAKANVDKQEIINKFSSEPVPEDVTENYWIIGYVNKALIHATYSRQIQSFRLFLAIIGAIQVTGVMLGTVFIVNRWNWSKRDLAIAKAIRYFCADVFIDRQWI